MVNKRANSYCHCYAVNRGPSREIYFKWKKCDSPLCRNGCGVIETMEHIFLDCGVNANLRKELLNLAKENRVNLSLQTIFGDVRFRSMTEKFISNFHRLNKS